MSFKREVTPENLRLLDRIYRQSRHHQVRQRAHCIILRQRGMSVPQLLEIFPVSRKTLYNWFESWESDSVVGLYNRPGRRRKATFDSEQRNQIQAWVKAHPRQLKTVLEKIKAEWDITVSIQTVKRVLKALKMSWHRFRRGVAGQPDVQEYAAKQAQLNRLQQLDEAGEIDLLLPWRVWVLPDSLCSLRLAANWRNAGDSQSTVSSLERVRVDETRQSASELCVRAKCDQRSGDCLY